MNIQLYQLIECEHLYVDSKWYTHVQSTIFGSYPFVRSEIGENDGKWGTEAFDSMDWFI